MMVVGATANDRGGDIPFPSGAAYVFVRNGVSWAEAARLESPEATDSDQFGMNVAVDQDTAVVASKDQAYVFKRVASNWILDIKLPLPGDSEVEFPAVDVAIDGDTIVVGRYGNPPEAFVFRRAGNTWQLESTLTDDQDFSDFGIRVALDGQTALIGAPTTDVGTPSQVGGAAHVFTRDLGTWTRHPRLTGKPVNDFNNFGIDVALSGDRALIRVSRLPSFESGFLVFTRATGTSTWAQQGAFTFSVAEGGHPGIALDKRFAVAATDRGIAYVFDLDPDDQFAAPPRLYPVAGDNRINRAEALAGIRIGGLAFLFAWVDLTRALLPCTSSADRRG
jgi:hypothetical protein